MEHQHLDLIRQTLNGQSLFVDGKAEFRSSIWLCELIDCAIKSTASARAFGFVDSVMRGGLFWQQKLLNNKSFDRVRFEGVKFKGNFKGVDFGGRTDSSDYPVESGALEGCDLTEAKLHACRHFNGDFASNRYAGWPTVVVRCGGEFSLLTEAPGEGEQWGLFLKCFEAHPRGEHVVIDNAEQLSKFYAISLKKLRAFFELNRKWVISDL